MINKSMIPSFFQTGMAVIDRPISLTFINVLWKNNKALQCAMKFKHLLVILPFITLLFFMGVIPSGYNTTSAFAAADPNGLWHMDGDWTDASGNGNNGTGYNGAAFTTNARVGSQAGSFDGVDDYIEKRSPGSVLNIGSQAFTIAAWIKTSYAGTAEMEIVSRYECGWNNCSSPDGNANAYYKLCINGSGAAGFAVRSDNGNSAVTSDVNSVRDGAWHYIAGVLDRSAGTLKIYVDGAEKQSVSAASLNAINDGGSPFEIGRYFREYWASPIYYFSGLIDEVAVYNRALSAEEISDLYDSFAPSVMIISPAPGATNDNTPLLNYTITGGIGTVKVDGSIVSKVSGDSLDVLSDGPHTVRVEAVSSIGKTGFAEVTFTVDTVPPTVSIDPVTSPTSTNSQTITGSMESGATVTVSVDTTAAPGSVTYPTASTWSCTITWLATGANNITVTAKDAAGNAARATASIFAPSSLDNSLIALWHMDGDWTDASGSGNNGTAYNGATFSTNGQVGSQAGSFDGVDDYVKVKSTALIANSSQSSIVAWVKPSTFGRYIYTENNANGVVFCLYLASDGKVGFGVWRTDISGNWTSVTSRVALSLNVWSQVAATLDATGMKVYVNGVLVGFNAGNNRPSNSTIVEVSIGRVSNSGGGLYFSGLTDEVAVYNRALTAEGVLYLYHQGTVPVVTITSPQPGPTDDATPLLTYSVSHGTTTVKVDGAVVNKISGNELDLLPEGPHVVRVEAANNAGMTGYAEIAFVVDTAPPTLTVDPVTSPTYTSTQNLTGTVESGATITVTANTSATPGPVTYPTATTWSCTITGLAVGANGITVTARDAASNSAAVTTSITLYSLTISNVVVSSNTLNTAASESSTIFFSTNAPAATVTLKIIPEKQGPAGTPVYQASQFCAAIGAYLFTWDGKDNTGKVVPDEAYLYILEATDGNLTGGYNPPAPTGTASISCSQEAGYDPYKNDPLTVSYSVSRPARVDINIAWQAQYFKIMNAVPHVPGSYTFDWDGRNLSGKVLPNSGKAFCTVASLLRENHIITRGDTPKVTLVKTDPYQMDLSYGQFMRTKYTLSRDASVTVKILPRSGSAITLINGEAQTAGAHELEWNGLDVSDATGKRLLVSLDGTYTVSIQAVNPVTGSNSTAKGSLKIGY